MEKQELFSLIDQNVPTLEELALDLWNHPEISHEEFRSSKLDRKSVV